jgi:hypothetical protein
MDGEALKIFFEYFLLFLAFFEKRFFTGARTFCQFAILPTDTIPDLQHSD